MDANGNQRKRGGRIAKNLISDGNILTTQNMEANDVIGVSAITKSPTLELAANNSAIPAAECRRSSRKKIIKFDVRDLLNKNRKTHKIQIEARIDSNAPSTSKDDADGNSLFKTKTATTAREDLLSKQKTFLEKSAIFRRYSISQEHKPPPIPIPPLLGKANDNKEAVLSTSSSARRLSRTQEFFSNVMIKPKQTTSLIVAQIESNAPSSSTAPAKRKSLNKSVEFETRVNSSLRSESQKKRGRPAKIKTQNIVETKVNVPEQEEVTKKITPEKATNWKEYKACLAQQSNSSRKATESFKTDNEEKLITSQQHSEFKKQQIEILTDLTNPEDTSQSDISKSEDDFSGFQTSKDELSCDSPVLANKSLEDLKCCKESFNEMEIQKNLKKKIEEPESNQKKIYCTNEKMTLTKYPKQFENDTADTEKFEQSEILSSSQLMNTNQRNKGKLHNEKAESLISEENLNQNIVENISTAEIKKSQKELELFLKNEPKIKINDISQIKVKEDNEKQPQYVCLETKFPTVFKALDPASTYKTEETETGKNKLEWECLSKKKSINNIDIGEDVKGKLLNDKKTKNCKLSKKSSIKSPKILANNVTEMLSVGITLESQTKPIQENIIEYKIFNKNNGDKIEDHTISEDDKKQALISSSEKQTNAETTNIFVAKQATNEHTMFEKEDIGILEVNKQENTKEDITPDICPKAAEQLMEQCTPQTEHALADVLLTNKKTLLQTSTPSEIKLKTVLQTSSSSESEHSSYSSDPSSITCSSSPNSDKSCDKLRVSLSRVSLPRSPSSSSLKSNSENFNTSFKDDVLRKKPPMGKHYKKIKRSVEVQKNKVNENINDCFQKIIIMEKEDTKKPFVDKQENDEICNETAGPSNSNKKFETENSPVQNVKKDVYIIPEILEIVEYKEKETTDIKIKTFEETNVSDITPNETKKFVKTIIQHSDDKEEKKDNSDKFKIQTTEKIQEKGIEVKTLTQSNIKEKKPEETLTEEFVAEKPLETIKEKFSEKNLNIQLDTESNSSKEKSANQLKRKTRSVRQRNFKNQETSIDKVNYKTETILFTEVSKIQKDNYSDKQFQLKEFQLNLLETTDVAKPIEKQCKTESQSQPKKVLDFQLKTKNNKESLPFSKDISFDKISEIKTSETFQDITITGNDNVNYQKESNEELPLSTSTENLLSTSTRESKIQTENVTNKPKEMSPRENKQNVSTSNKAKCTDLQEKVEKKSPNRSKISQKDDLVKTNRNPDDLSNNECTISEINESEASEPTEASIVRSKKHYSKITSVRGRPKKENILVEEKFCETAKNSNEISADFPSLNVSTNIVADLQAEYVISSRDKNLLVDSPISSKNAATQSQLEFSFAETSNGKSEILTAKSFEKSISSQKDVICMHAKSPTLETTSIVETPETQIICSQSSKISSDLAASSPFKRKSLRKQKYKKSANSPEALLSKTITDMHGEYSKSTLESSFPDEYLETQKREPSQSSNCSSNVSIETKNEKSTDNFQNLVFESEPKSQLPKSKTEEQTVKKEIPEVTKRRDPKLKLKNLCSLDVETVTDNSNENNSLTAEITQRRLKDLDAKQNTEKQMETKQEIKDAKKEAQSNQFVEELDEIKQTSNTNLLSSQIQNVSIETNTLLDILRTVQSNTEAALKACNSPVNDNKTENVNESTNETNLKIGQTSAETCKSSETVEENAIGSNKMDNELFNESSIDFDVEKCAKNSKPNTEIKCSSTTRTEIESPLSLKHVPLSPARSDSSSPLTIKKVTRRYERRNRRGEDIAHKTLEETFAEIAAQSSKAVLAAKEFDINEQQTIDEKSLNEECDINIIADAEKELLEDFEKTKPNVEEEKFEKNTLPSEIVEKALNVEQLVDGELKSLEIVVESQELTKVTPARRGRKPKNRFLEIPVTITKDDEVNKSPKSKKEQVEENLIVNEPQEKPDEIAFNILKTEESKKLENNSNKIKEAKTITTVNVQTESFKVKDNADKYKPKEVDDLSLVLEDELLKSFNDSNELKMSDTTKADECTLINADKKGDVQISPKQSLKKRDTSQTKSEIKSGGKKISKKTKSEDEDSTLGKSVLSNFTTTPPHSKRGRKPKNQQLDTPQTLSSSKKKNKKGSISDLTEEDFNEETSESPNTSFDKFLDEKLAKKKRQKKLKEDFEAALIDDIKKNKEAVETALIDDIKKNKEAVEAEISLSNFGLTELDKSPSPTTEQEKSLTSYDRSNEYVKISCVTPVEEDPDPLKDIEKFIADGVNLLKKDYKLNEDSVDDVITPTSTPSKVNETLEEPIKLIAEVYNTFETPADTPINTPCVTPPPKSPSSIESHTPDENSGVRRSHRIKLITKTPKALVGRGLVKDKERFSIKDDVETKSHYTLDDHLTDLAEVEAKNAKFLKEMEERLSNFQVIKENEYLCERVISREARKMICDCFLTQEEEERGELGCGEDCLNRLLMIECGFECNVKERCTNKRFQKLLCSPCRVFRTEKKGFGIMADIEILPGEFIMEYVGEVIDTEEFEKRRISYSKDKNRHYYFMALRSDAIIDATIKGNISRFINHSCDPNAETQKWTVNGELRIGFFSRKSIMPGEEITFNYQYQRYGREAQRCYCEATNCRGWIGQEPTSDEGEQIDDDEYEESEEEEADASNLLVQDDDEDSDASVTDPEEVQKQLEMAAAQAEVELAPLQLMEEKSPNEKSIPEIKSAHDPNKSESEEDSKSKFKKLLTKMAEKVAAKQKQNKREQKMQRKKKSKESSTDLSNKLKFLEDPDIEDEVEFLKECGLKNQSDTLRLSRLMVRAKLLQTRLNLLKILRLGDLPCRRLFLDYHGLRLLHGWMSEDAGNMQIRMALLQTLETLPIANKTVLTDSKVMQVVRNWCRNNSTLSPSEDSSSSNSNSQDVPIPASGNFEEGSEFTELQKLALKLITTWDGLPEIFRIPKKERIEQMKEHEREADRQYAANAEKQEENTATDRYSRNRFGRFGCSNAASNTNRFIKPNNGNLHRTTNTTPENNKNLSKAQRREMFAAKVARDEAEKRMAEERREFETKCRFFGLDPKKTRQQDIPFSVNPATGQWFSIERKPIITPPSYAHVQVPVKLKSTDPNDYQLPAICSTLPAQWKYAITPQGKIYYYHIKDRLPQWEPPSSVQLLQCELEAREDDSESELTMTTGEDSSDDDDDILIGLDSAQLKAYIDRKVEMRRQKRYQRLVDERSISPRREEDRIYNQIEVRKYKENKEKIRKRKEDIRRKRAEALRQSTLNMCTEAQPVADANKLPTESEEKLAALPIQDYLLSSDEEVDLKAEVNSPLIDKIVEGDKIVDELDALTTKRQLKRPLPPHRELNEPSTSSVLTIGLNPIIARQEYKKRKLEKKEKRKPKEQDAKYRKNKEKFRCEIAGIIVHHLKPYRKETCTVGRIQSNEDFNHLARKLTHFVMIKELKYCESVGQTLVVTESVKSKSREFIKKYMAKYGDVYIKPINDPDFKDIPFTL